MVRLWWPGREILNGTLGLLLPEMMTAMLFLSKQFTVVVGSAMGFTRLQLLHRQAISIFKVVVVHG
ncbi:hypothetical protein BZL42_22460 [Pseudomonas indica]|nr:hypothetical protein BZL42_22460 [Pseudomonas indica]